MFSATSALRTGPGPGAYNVDAYRSIGGSTSLKFRVNARPRPLDGPSRTLTSGIDYLQVTSGLSHRKTTIAPYYSLPTLSSASIGPSFLPEPSPHSKLRHIKIKNRYPTKEASVTPGPGEYNPRFWPRTSHPPMGPRPPICLSAPSFAPGPGRYDICRDLGAGSR
jgi:hypothetical protein